MVEEGREPRFVSAIHYLSFELVVLLVTRHDVLHLVQFVEGLQTRNYLFQIILAGIVVNVLDLLLIFSNVAVSRFQALRCRLSHIVRLILNFLTQVVQTLLYRRLQVVVDFIKVAKQHAVRVLSFWSILRTLLI